MLCRPILALFSVTIDLLEAAPVDDHPESRSALFHSAVASIEGLGLQHVMPSPPTQTITHADTFFPRFTQLTTSPSWLSPLEGIHLKADDMDDSWLSMYDIPDNTRSVHHDASTSRTNKNHSFEDVTSQAATGEECAPSDGKQILSQRQTAGKRAPMSIIERNARYRQRKLEGKPPAKSGRPLDELDPTSPTYIRDRKRQVRQQIYYRKRGRQLRAIRKWMKEAMSADHNVAEHKPTQGQAIQAIPSTSTSAALAVEMPPIERLVNAEAEEKEKMEKRKTASEDRKRRLEAMSVEERHTFYAKRRLKAKEYRERMDPVVRKQKDHIRNKTHREKQMNKWNVGASTHGSS